MLCALMRACPESATVWRATLHQSNTFPLQNDARNRVGETNQGIFLPGSKQNAFDFCQPSNHLPKGVSSRARDSEIRIRCVTFVEIRAKSSDGIRLLFAGVELKTFSLCTKRMTWADLWITASDICAQPSGCVEALRQTGGF